MWLFTGNDDKDQTSWLFAYTLLKELGLILLDFDTAKTRIIRSAIFKLQNVNVVLKMAVIFIIVADTYTVLFVTVFVTFLRHDKFLWRVQFLSSRSTLHVTQIPRETENSLSYWGFVVRTLLIINKESCFTVSWVVFLIINLFRSQ